MNAAETLKETSAAADQRAYEPSMEEILASIRRIIADDQSLPNRAFVRDGEATLRAALDSPASYAAPDTVSYRAPEPVAVASAPLTSEAAEVIAIIDEELKESLEVASTLRVPSARSLGHIAAPQFAMPDSPSPSHDARREAESSASVLATEHPAVDVAPPQLDMQETLRAEQIVRADNAIGSVVLPEAREAPAAPQSGQFDKRPEAAAQEPETDSMSSLFSTATDQTVTAAFNTLAASRLVENDDALQDMVRDMIRPLLKSWLDDNLPNMVERLVRAEIERVGRGGR